ncbi:glycosyltransferase family 4 protein [Microvirga guangxiensis]|uniref:glycosyltransferase family 4 protein n=1 Tax=Microvirga guangxiensis TaxID=549386 RepID=UPI001587AB01|nr:glycosyltransferase family 4 protein [Microvirga guangxiensis]
MALVIDGLGAGGAEKTTSDIAAALTETGIDTTVVYLQGRASNAALEVCDRHNVSTLHVQVSRLWKLREWMALIRSIRKLKPDAIHAHLHYATITSIVVGALLRIRTVVTLHTLDEPNQWSKAGLRLRLMFFLIKYLPCELVCLTNQAKAMALKYAPTKIKSVHVIPNGLNLSEWSSDRRVAKGDASDKPMIMLSVAVLRRMKGIHHLIRAHGVLSRRYPNLHLWIVGDGPERENLEYEAELAGNSDKVFFAGHRSDVRELMQSADLFVLPTLIDALPTVIIEAMAAGLPVIASRTGGIPEMVDDGETGLLVEPANENDLISACERIIQSPKFAESLGRAARDSVERNFDLNTQVERLLVLYGLRKAA